MHGSGKHIVDCINLHRMDARLPNAAPNNGPANAGTGTTHTRQRIAGPPSHAAPVHAHAHYDCGLGPD